jgi:hypothetical protein
MIGRSEHVVECAWRYNVLLHIDRAGRVRLCLDLSAAMVSLTSSSRDGAVPLLDVSVSPLEVIFGIGRRGTRYGHFVMRQRYTFHAWGATPACCCGRKARWCARQGQFGQLGAMLQLRSENRCRAYIIRPAKNTACHLMGWKNNLMDAISFDLRRKTQYNCVASLQCLSKNHRSTCWPGLAATAL